MSWIAVDRQTGMAVVELWSRRLVAKVNRERYVVLTAYDYLLLFNESVRRQVPLAVLFGVASLETHK